MRTVPPSLADADCLAAERPGAGRLDTGLDVVGRQLRGSSLNRAMDVVGDWWTQRILREAFLGVRNFEAFHEHLQVPRQTLSSRLRDLVDNGVLHTTRGGYRLTARGLALYPWALMIWRWSRTWGGAAGPRHPQTLVHLDCGHAMTPRFACGACRKDVTLRDVDHAFLPGARPSGPAESGAKRWAGGRFVLDARHAAHHIAFITADRWTHLLIGAVFLGCRTFDVMQRELGISTNVLSQRLSLLVTTGFLDKRRAADDARRFHYRLTPRGRDVFPLTMALVQWADAWLPTDTGPPQLRHHRTCGAPLQARVLCSHCGGELLPRRVSFPDLPPAAGDSSRGA